MAASSNESLTPEEAGAFAAQWSEHRSVTLDELAAKLEIPSDKASAWLEKAQQILSARRQAVAGKYSPRRSSPSNLLMVMAAVGGLVVGGALSYVGLVRMHRGDRETVVASSPTPQPGSGLVSANGLQPLPGPSAAEIEERRGLKSIPNRSSNTILEAQGIAIPDDLLIAVHTPTINFVAKGKDTKKIASAKAIKIQQLLKDSDALLRYALQQGSIEAYRDPGTGSPPSGEVQLKLGAIFVTMPIQWILTNRGNLYHLFDGESSLGAKSLIQPLLAKIRASGNLLFGSTNRLVNTSGLAAVEAKGIRVPDDFLFTVDTPQVYITVSGKLTKNVKAVTHVKSEDIARVLNAMIDYAIEMDPLPKEVPQYLNSTNGSVSVYTGTIGGFQIIHWEESSRHDLESMFKGANSSGMTKMIIPFLEKVHRAGVYVFSPQAAAIATSAQPAPQPIKP